MVNRVMAQIRAPSGSDPGQVTTCYYVVENGVLIMTRGDGTPVDAVRYRHALRPEDNPDVLAKVFGKQIRREALDITEDQERFYRSLDYVSSGVA
jgi:hypothetical protein